MNIANALKCSVDVFLEDEYSYTEDEASNADKMIRKKLELMDKEHKEKLLKIIELI